MTSYNTVEQQLVQLKEIACGEVGEHKLDKREYVKQRFGVDSEPAL